MGLLDKKSILNSQDIKVERVDVPEWGGYVFVKGMTASERDQFETIIANRSNELGGEGRTVMDNFRAALAAFTIVDKNGERLFDLDDVEALNQKSAAALQRIYEKSKTLSRIGNDDVEELTKNSDSGQPEGSPTD